MVAARLKFGAAVLALGVLLMFGTLALLTGEWDVALVDLGLFAVIAYATSPGR